MLAKKRHATKGYSNHFVYGLGFHGFHRIHYLEWNSGPKRQKDTLVCVHGLTRNARDFDYFAEKMSSDYRVICPDVVGRGESDHLIDPEGYTYLQYNADMNAVLARLNVPEVDWIGTSMGGIIGMVLAAQPQSPIRRLVINDIGPTVKREPQLAIAEYIGRSGTFKDLDEVENYFRGIYKEFAPMTDEDWKQFAKHSTRRMQTGQYRLKFDHRIGDVFRDNLSPFDFDMWDTWDNISCPVLVLRGENSTFLTEEIAERMLTCGPHTTLVTFSETGHTPTLRNEEQVDIVRDWLAQDPSVIGDN